MLSWCTQRSRRKPQNWSRSDVGASPHCKLWCLFGPPRHFLSDKWWRRRRGARGPVNDLGNAECHFIFSFHFLTTRSWYDFSLPEYECAASCTSSETYPITPQNSSIPSFVSPLFPQRLGAPCKKKKRQKTLSQFSWQPFKNAKRYSALISVAFVWQVLRKGRMWPVVRI